MFSCEIAGVGMLSTGGRDSSVEEMALTTYFGDEMEQKKILSISCVESLGEEFWIGQKEGYTACICQKGVMLQVVLETIVIALAALSLTLNVMFNSSLFKVMPLAVRVLKRQMNVLSNNCWETCGSLAKHWWKEWRKMHLQCCFIEQCFCMWRFNLVSFSLPISYYNRNA